MNGGELIYFELDRTGQLNEVGKVTLEGEILCLDVGDIPDQRERCKFLAVGLSDNTVRILSLDPESCL